MLRSSTTFHFRQISAFLAVAEALSFTRAAERLGSTQPTISHQIAEIEERLGVLLFDRIGKTVRLTEAGSLFQEFAARSIKQIDDGVVALSELDGLARGTLRLGAIQSVSRTLLAPVLGAFVTKYPGVRLSVTEMSAKDIETGLADGRFDLGIAFAPALHDETELEPILNEKLILVVANDHRLAKFANVPMRNLTDVRMALLESTYSTRRLIDRYLEEAGARPDVVFTTNAMAVMLALVAQSDLATIVPQAGLDRGHYPLLRTIELTDPTPSRTSALLWPRHGFRRAAARAFAAMLRQHFAGLTF